MAYKDTTMLKDVERTPVDFDGPLQIQKASFNEGDFETWCFLMFFKNDMFGLLKFRMFGVACEEGFFF